MLVLITFFYSEKMKKLGDAIHNVDSQYGIVEKVSYGIHALAEAVVVTANTTVSLAQQVCS